MAIHHNINIGERFHHLVVKSPPFRKPDKYWYMECNCDCGNVKAVKCKDAVSGHIKSCGCWSRNRPRSGRVTHGKSCTPTWWSYRGMLTRCYNPKQPSFKEYGARELPYASGGWPDSRISWPTWENVRRARPSIVIPTTTAITSRAIVGGRPQRNSATTSKTAIIWPSTESGSPSSNGPRPPVSADRQSASG